METRVRVSLMYSARGQGKKGMEICEIRPRPSAPLAQVFLSLYRKQQFFCKKWTLRSFATAMATRRLVSSPLFFFSFFRVFSILDLLRKSNSYRFESRSLSISEMNRCGVLSRSRAAPICLPLLCASSLLSSVSFPSRAPFTHVTARPRPMIPHRSRRSSSRNNPYLPDNARYYHHQQVDI